MSLSDGTKNVGSAVASDTREVLVTYIDHAVYEVVVRVPTTVADDDLPRWMDESDAWIDAAEEAQLSEITYREIIETSRI